MFNKNTINSTAITKYPILTNIYAVVWTKNLENCAFLSNDNKFSKMELVYVRDRPAGGNDPQYFIVNLIKE